MSFKTCWVPLATSPFNDDFPLTATFSLVLILLSLNFAPCLVASSSSEICGFLKIVIDFLFLKGFGEQKALSSTHP